MHVSVPKNVVDCTSLKLVCQQLVVEFSETDSIECMDLYQYEPQEWNGNGPFPQLKYVGKEHPQWMIKNESK